MEDVKYFYKKGDMAFFSSDLPGVVESNGYTFDELTEISAEDYSAWFNPPDGKYGGWVDGDPVLLDLPPVDYVAIAESERQNLLAEANHATYSLNLKLMMGRKLTASETATVNSWLDYSDALAALDLSGAPDIEWPEKPA